MGNTVKTAHVLNSVAVHFRSAEQIVILTTSVFSSVSVLIEMTDYPLSAHRSLMPLVCTSQLSVETTLD